MSKRVAGVMTFPGHSPEEVFAMMTTTDYQVEKLTKTGGLNARATVEPAGDSVVVTTYRELPADIPSFAKKFTGDPIESSESITWTGPDDSGSYRAQATVTFGQAPLTMKGTATIEASDEGSLFRLEMDVKASIPLIGGKVESFASEQILRSLRNEEPVGQEWLG